MPLKELCYNGKRVWIWKVEYNPLWKITVSKMARILGPSGQLDPETDQADPRPIFLLTRIRFPAKLLCHMFNLWLVSCSLLLSRTFLTFIKMGPKLCVSLILILGRTDPQMGRHPVPGNTGQFWHGRFFFNVWKTLERKTIKRLGSYFLWTSQIRNK